MNPLSYDPSTGDFVFTPLDETEGSKSQRKQAKKYNAAAKRVMQIGNSAIGTKNQYMNFKRQILKLNLSNRKKKELLKPFDEYYKTNVIKTKFDSKLTPQPTAGEFDSKYYLSRYPQLKEFWDKKVQNGDLDFTYFYDNNPELWARGHYLNHGKKEGRYANYVTDPANYKSKGDVADFVEAKQSVTDADIQAIRDRELFISTPQSNTIQERLKGSPEIQQLFKQVRKGNDQEFNELADQYNIDLTTFAGFLEAFARSDSERITNLKQGLVDSGVIKPDETYISQAEDALYSALGEQGLEDTERFGLLAQDVLKQAIAKLENAQDNSFYDQLLGMGELGEIQDFSSNISNELMADIGGGALPSKYREELEGSIDKMFGLGNNTIVNWQNWFDEQITEKYAKGYEKVFEKLETEKRILENSTPTDEDYELYVRGNDDLEKEYIAKYGNKSYVDDDFKTRAEFGRDYYERTGKNRNDKNHNKLFLEVDIFDPESEEFSQDFLKKAGFFTSDDLVDYLKESPEGRNVLYTITDEAFLDPEELVDLTKLNINDRIQAIDNDIEAADASGDYDYVFTTTDADGETREIQIEAQFARDFINDYLRPRFDSSKSMDEFIDYLDVDENLQNPWQTQSTLNALQDLAQQRTEEYLEQIKPTDSAWDPHYYQNPFKDRDDKYGEPKDSSRYEQKLALQRDTFRQDWDAARNGDSRWLQRMYNYGVEFKRNSPKKIEAGATPYDINWQQFTKMHYETVGKTGKDIDGNDILLNGKTVQFSPFENIIDRDRIQRFISYDMLPALLEKVDDVGPIFGDFISADEFADDVLEDYGLNDEGQYAQVMKELGLDKDTDFDELRGMLVEAVQGGNAAAIRESLKILQEKGETPTQKELGATYIEREIDDIEIAGEGEGLYGIFQAAGFKGTENEFYDTFFPGQDRGEVKSEFGGFGNIGGILSGDLGSPQEALGSLSSALDDPFDSADGFGSDIFSNDTKTKKSKAGSDFLSEFTSGMGLGGFGGFGGFGL